MKVPWEDKLPCAALALLVLAVFYGIYFAKMLAQKRRGIQARQIGRRREKDIHTVEVLMSLATLARPLRSCSPSLSAGATFPRTRGSPASASGCWATPSFCCRSFA